MPKNNGLMNHSQMPLQARKALSVAGSWFARLPANVQDELLSAGRQRQLLAGNMLFRAGDVSTGLHGLLSGELHLVGSASNGHDMLMAINRKGDWTGFLACIDGQPHTLSAKAAVDCNVFSISRTAVLQIFERDVATFRLLLGPELVVGRRNYRWLVEMLTRPTLQRIAERLVDLGRWTHGDRTGPVSPIEHVSQEDLAAATNVSRQTMNSALNELEALGLIKVGYGRIDIIDSQGLDALAISDVNKTG